MQTITFYVFTIFIIIGSLALGKFLVRETPNMITKIIYKTISQPIIVFTKAVNDSRFRELAIFTTYFLIMLSALLIFTLMKNSDYVLSVLPVEIFINPHIPIAKAGLIISAGLIIYECIHLYRTNKKGDNNV